MVLYGLGEKLMADARRRVVIIDEALSRVFKFDHDKRIEARSCIRKPRK